MYVCVCNALTDKDIIEASGRGARTYDDAFRMLGAEVCCGQCRCMAEEVIESAATKSIRGESHGAYALKVCQGVTRRLGRLQPSS